MHYWVNTHFPICVAKSKKMARKCIIQERVSGYHEIARLKKILIHLKHVLGGGGGGGASSEALGFFMTGMNHEANIQANIQ